MILDFSISNYRSIRDMQTISFEATKDTHLEEYYVVKKGKYRILKIASILGANASGKSNVLTAFYLLPQLLLSPCVDKNSSIKYDKFALDSDSKNKHSEMKVSFIFNESLYQYKVIFNNLSVISESLFSTPFGKPSHKVYIRSTDIEKNVSTVVWGDKYKSAVLKELNVNVLHNRTVFGAFLTSNIDIPWMKEMMDWLDSYLMPMVRTSNQNLVRYTSKSIKRGEVDQVQITSLLAKADIGVEGFSIDEKKEDLPEQLVEAILKDPDAPEELRHELAVNPTKTEYIVRMLHKGKQGNVLFDFQNESSGTVRYYELSSLLVRLIKGNHFIAIDELENKLHPDLYEHFIYTYLRNSQDSQLIYTTHMREFLNDPELFREDTVWFTEKDNDGQTELYSMADFDIKGNKSLANRYNAYKSGRFGAVPNLGDTNMDHNK